MRKRLWIACAVLAAAARGVSAESAFALKNAGDVVTVSCGGVDFTLRPDSAALWIPTEGRVEPLFSTTLQVQGADGLVYVGPDDRDVRFEVLEDGPDRKVLRADYSLSISERGKPCRPFDAARLVIDCAFLKDVPGAAITHRLVAREAFTFMKFNVGGPNLSGKFGRDWYYVDPHFSAGSTVAFYPFRVQLSSHGYRMEPGSVETRTFTCGRIVTPEDRARLRGLAAALGPSRSLSSGARGGEANVCRPTKLGREFGGRPLRSWRYLPILATRDGAKDYRPLASNGWAGPEDLSMSVKAASDGKFVYFRVTVRDAEAAKGDRLIVAFDGKETTYGAPSVREGGVLAYDVQLPRPKKDRVPFNIVAVDEDPGQADANWMELAPGLMGLRDATKFPVLDFTPAPPPPAPSDEAAVTFDAPWYLGTDEIPFSASVSAKASDLPAEVVVSVGGVEKARVKAHAGINVIGCSFAPGELKGGEQTVRVRLAKGKGEGVGGDVGVGKFVLLTEDELKTRIDRVEGLVKELEGRALALTKSDKRDAYLECLLAMARRFVPFMRSEIAAKTVNRKYKIIAPDRNYRLYMLKRVWQNATYLEALLAGELTRRADDLAAGRIKPMRTVEYAKGVRPVIADGGFKVDGRELLLFGPNTWTNTKGFHCEDLEDIAATGFNLFNLFYVGGEKRDGLMAFAERTGMYWSWGGTTTTDKDLYKPHDQWPKRILERQKDPNFYIQPFPRDSAQGVFQVTLPEQFTRDYEKTPAWAGDFQKHLKGKFGSLETVNDTFGTSFANWTNVDFAAVLACPPLKYESFVYRTSCEYPRLGRNNAFKKSFWKLPTSAHYSTHFNFASLDPLVVLADFEGIWAECDVIGFDGGLGLEGSEYAIDFVKGGFELDFARSCHPEKPVANNEDHIIHDGIIRDYGKDELYLAYMLTYLLGQNAGSDWAWVSTFHTDGEYAYTKANTYHEAIRAVLALRTFPEEIGAFRHAPNPPLRILHSLPSMTDRDSYMRSFYGLYAAASFTGWPVRYLTERMLAAGDFKGAKIVLVPDARRVSDATFAALADFAKKGGEVLLFGDEALKNDEYGRPVPARAAARAAFRTVGPKGDRAISDLLNARLAEKRLRHADLQSSAFSIRPRFGVLWRTAETAAGDKVAFVANLSCESVTVRIPKAGWFSRWTEILSGRDVSGDVVLRPRDLLLLEKH